MTGVWGNLNTVICKRCHRCIYMIALNFCQVTIIITAHTHRNYERDIVVWIYILVNCVNVGLTFTMNLTTMVNE